MALEEVTEAFASEVFEARVDSEARLVRDVDRPFESRSNTLEPEDLRCNGISMFSAVKLGSLKLEFRYEEREMIPSRGFRDIPC